MKDIPMKRVRVGTGTFGTRSREGLPGPWLSIPFCVLIAPGERLASKEAIVAAIEAVLPEAIETTKDEATPEPR